MTTTSVPLDAVTFLEHDDDPRDPLEKRLAPVGPEWSEGLSPVGRQTPPFVVLVLLLLGGDADQTLRLPIADQDECPRLAMSARGGSRGGADRPLDGLAGHGLVGEVANRSAAVHLAIEGLGASQQLFTGDARHLVRYEGVPHSRGSLPGQRSTDPGRTLAGRRQCRHMDNLRTWVGDGYVEPHDSLRVDRPMSRYRPTIVIVALALIAAACGSGGEVQSSAPGTSSPGVPPAPARVFELFDGSETSLADFRGRPVVLNFWASWCPSCVAEMSAAFRPVQERVGSEITFIGMNIQDVRSLADDLLAETGVRWTNAIDPDGDLYAELGGLGMPFTVFIDASGGIVEEHNGPLSEAQLVERISELFGVTA